VFTILLLPWQVTVHLTHYAHFLISVHVQHRASTSPRRGPLCRHTDPTAFTNTGRSYSYAKLSKIESKD